MVREAHNEVTYFSVAGAVVNKWTTHNPVACALGGPVTFYTDDLTWVALYGNVQVISTSEGTPQCQR